MLHHHRLTMREVPVRMFARGGGVSSISGSGKSAYYMVKVLLALFVGLARRRPVVEPGDDAPVAASQGSDGPAPARLHPRRGRAADRRARARAPAAAARALRAAVAVRAPSCSSASPPGAGRSSAWRRASGSSTRRTRCSSSRSASSSCCCCTSRLAVSRLSDQIKVLAQRLALMEQRMRRARHGATSATRSSSLRGARARPQHERHQARRPQRRAESRRRSQKALAVAPSRQRRLGAEPRASPTARRSRQRGSACTRRRSSSAGSRRRCRAEERPAARYCSARAQRPISLAAQLPRVLARPARRRSHVHDRGRRATPGHARRADPVDVAVELDRVRGVDEQHVAASSVRKTASARPGNAASSRLETRQAGPGDRRERVKCAARPRRPRRGRARRPRAIQRRVAGAELDDPGAGFAPRTRTMQQRPAPRARTTSLASASRPPGRCGCSAARLGDRAARLAPGDLLVDVEAVPRIALAGPRRRAVAPAGPGAGCSRLAARPQAGAVGAGADRQAPLLQLLAVHVTATVRASAVAARRVERRCSASSTRTTRSPAAPSEIGGGAVADRRHEVLDLGPQRLDVRQPRAPDVARARDVLAVGVRAARRSPCRRR